MKKPRYPLSKAKRLELSISRKCLERACQFLRISNLKAAEKHVTRLFRSLTTDDFSETVLMGFPKRAVLGDVYGKKDQHGLWYIKIDCSSDVTTVVMSCHEAEYDIRLATSGRTLRKGKEP